MTDLTWAVDANSAAIRRSIDWRSPLVVVIPLIMLDAIWLWIGHVFLVGWERQAEIVLAIATVSLVCRFWSPVVAEYVSYIWLWAAFTASGAVLTYLVAALSFPLADASFAKMDAALGFDWLAWDNFVASYPMLNRLLAYAYNSHMLLLFISIGVFATLAPGRNTRLLWTTMIAVLLTTLLFGLFPAIGPSAQFHINFPYMDDLYRLRSGLPQTIEMTKLAGIITFPSFHAVIATLLLYYHRGLFTAYPVGLICILMWISSLATGGHYVTDLIAGTMIALISIWMTRLVYGRATGATS